MNVLFAYGTLLDKNTQDCVFGHAIPGRPDYLTDYKRVVRTFKCGTYPDIIFEKKSIVSGMILELTDMEIEQCDRYEGDEYERITVALKSGINAFVYKGK